jgi:hypothetical protein
MAESAPKPPLKSLHLDSSLNTTKLAQMDRLSTESLLASLLPGAPSCLKRAGLELYWRDLIAPHFASIESGVCAAVEQRDWIERYAPALTK